MVDAVELPEVLAFRLPAVGVGGDAQFAVRSEELFDSGLLRAAERIPGPDRQRRWTRGAGGGVSFPAVRRPAARLRREREQSRPEKSSGGSEFQAARARFVAESSRSATTPQFRFFKNASR
jgi:hypothetical protein